MNSPIPPGVASPNGPIMTGMGPSGPRMNVHRFVAALLLFGAGVLFAISVALSWWTLSESGGGGGSISFLPGSSLRLTSGGSSGTQTYASTQLGPVGGLYEAILALAVVLACLAIISGLLALLASLGRQGNPGRYATFRNLFVVVLIIGLFLLILVPAAQGALVRQSSLGPTLCGLTDSSNNPCNSFWGSASAGGDNYSWGADAGWYIALVATIFLVGALFLWRSARSDPWVSPGAAMTGMAGGSLSPAAPPTPETPADKLLRAKALADAGQISPAEFEELKARLLRQSAEPGPGGGTAAPPEVELGKLKALRDSGAISDAEYADLRKRVLLRF